MCLIILDHKKQLINDFQTCNNPLYFDGSKKITSHNPHYCVEELNRVRFEPMLPSPFVGCRELLQVFGSSQCISLEFLAIKPTPYLWRLLELEKGLEKSAVRNLDWWTRVEIFQNLIY